MAPSTSPRGTLLRYWCNSTAANAANASPGCSGRTTRRRQHRDVAPTAGECSLSTETPLDVFGGLPRCATNRSAAARASLPLAAQPSTYAALASAQGAEPESDALAHMRHTIHSTLGGATQVQTLLPPWGPLLSIRAPLMTVCSLLQVRFTKTAYCFALN